MRRAAAAAGLLLLYALAAAAQEKKDLILKPGQFPPADAGAYIAGELIIIDPINRRGGIRLDGDGPNGRYNGEPLHYFAMLPCGMISRNGAPAELRDIPIGTHVHGRFLLPPAGEEQTIPHLPKDQAKYEIKYNHAITLEDDFSFYQSRKQSWKVVSIDTEKGKLNLAPMGELVKDGINKPYTFDIDRVAQIWQERKLVDLEAIKPDQLITFNLAWAQGWQDKEFSIGEIWLDEVSQKFATEMQQRRHLRYQRQRWVAGQIDKVEANDFGGGTVTLTLYGGMNPILYEELKASKEKGLGVAAAEKTLRTWFHRADKKIGQVQEWTQSPNPPPGSSGIQIKLKFTELLEGYRPGKQVRVKAHDWTFVTMPPEERIKSLEEKDRAATMSSP